MRRLFVLVPSLVPTGPVKGAVALCNSLADRFDVTLVALKPSPVFPDHIDSRIRVVDLGAIAGWRARLGEYRKMLEDADGRPGAISFSYCLSADVFNFLVRRHAVTLSSIRGHLLRTYRIDFGLPGPLLAILHFLIVGRLDCIVAMTDHMARQIAPIAGKRPIVIGNFVDEAQLEPLRLPSAVKPVEWRFVFVGRLDQLKTPDLVIKAVCKLVERGIPCSLDIYGDGPLMERLRMEVVKRDCTGIIRFHGYVDNPWALAASAHCLVLPSLTEGISRAALEALFLGVPCVLREVDSNSELIRSGNNGYLFGGDWSLAEAMKNAAQLGCRLASSRPILLGEQFRQATCIASYHRLLQQS